MRTIRPTPLLPVLMAAAAAAIPLEGMTTPLIAPAAVRSAVAASSLQTDATPDTIRDLRAVLDTGWIVQDRNDDGVVDFVDVRIVLPDDADAAEATAAAEVAARLGFETSGSDLGLAVAASDLPEGPPDAPLIVVGHRPSVLARAGIASATLLAGLAPGQGALVSLPVRPGLPRGGLAVVGRDATGLLTASAYLSGRYPAVWDPDGDPWSGVPERVEAFLAGGDLDAGDVVLERVVVDARRPGVSRAEVTVRVSDDAARAAAAAALRGGAPEEEPGTGPDPAAQDTTAAEPPAHSTLHTRHLHRLDVRVESPGAATVVRLAPDEPWRTASAGAPSGGNGSAFTLSQLYEVGGLYRDTNQDLVPDETAVRLVVDAGLAEGAGGAAGLRRPQDPGAPAAAAARSVATGIIDLATRIGLETAGARFPLTTVAGDDDPTDLGGLPLVVGTSPSLAARLAEEDRLPGWNPEPGHGTVRMVPDGPGGEPVLLVAGDDDAGTAAALDWLAGRAPYLWTHGKGEYRLKDAETAFRRFVQARDAPGQAALALHKLATWADRLAAGRTMDGAPLAETSAPGAPGGGGGVHALRIELAVQDAPDGLADVARAVVAERLPETDIHVATFSTGFGVGDTVYHRSFDFGWEVDDVRAALAEEVYANIRSGGSASVEVRVSEPPEIRAELEEEIRAALLDRGASSAEVTVLAAYKQGYSWVHDAVLPRLRELQAEGRPAETIRISYHTLEESDEIRWQTVAADTRWLQELYPIDAVLGRELGMPDSAVTFHATRRPEPIYTLTATDPAGDTLLADTFHPRYVVRPFFDLFPEYERVRVTTGWLTATAAGDTLVDRRVVTDSERFWDALQTDVYGRIVEYVMDIQDGEPSGSNAPYFDALDVRLRMSEPDYRIGVDEEVISSLEALHEDVYFETLTLFDLIGNRYGVGGLSYPGRVLPWIDPTGAGEPATATVTLTGKERGVPELVVTAERVDAEPERREYGLNPLPVPEPPLRAVSVGRVASPGSAAGSTATSASTPVAALLFEVQAVDSLDRYDELRERASEAAVDRTFLPAELLEGMLDALRQLHQEGLYSEALSWDRVARTDVLFRAEDDSTWARVASVPRSRAPLSTDNPRLLAEGWEWDGERMVQWQTPMPPAENDSILARLNTFPGARVYYLTESFLGQPVWALDLLPPQPAAYVSQAKLNALKPTLFISGRQHANEVSSTSHILRLAELLATDSTYRARLDRVNVVLHPITNPDGARLAVQMQETNPDFMLHAGYLGALGVDATAGERSDDPIYPESQARRRIRETWLPDAYVNMHGYPSHEWVQYFAGYSAWVRSRRGGARDWWAPRGWFIPGFGWVDDDEHPEYTEAQFAMLDSVAASIRAEPDVAAMNDRLYARYRKYGKEDREGFREHFRNEVLVYLALRGAEDIGQGVYSPRITWFATTTEAPDETARGDWLELVASAGLAHATALLEYLAGGEFDVEREVEARDGTVVRKVYRVKPVLPPSPDEEPGDATGTAPRRGGVGAGGG